jgi:nitroreductase
VRAFDDRQVEDEKRKAVVEAALRAPTAGNLSAYTVIEVCEQEKKDRLAVTCDNQPFIARSPLVLLFLADYQRIFDLFRSEGLEERLQDEGRELRSPGPGELMLGMSDALIAAQNAVIAAEALGLGSCYIGDILEHYEEHRQLFDLPDYVFPATLLCIGYPKGEYPPAEPTPHCRANAVWHIDRYRRLSKEELGRMYDPVIRRRFPGGELPGDVDSMGEYIYRRKYDSDFLREMERSLFAAMRPWMKRWNAE